MRSEAGPGFGSPLPSRDIVRTKVADFQRTPETSQIPFSAVIDAVAMEMQRSERQNHMTRAKWVSILKNHRVGLATTNGFRIDDFQAKFPHIKVVRLHAEENPTGDSLKDAESKARSAARIARKNRGKRFREALKNGGLPGVWAEYKQNGYLIPNPIIGLDAINSLLIPDIAENGTLTFKQLGKPERTARGEEMYVVQGRLKYMAELAQKHNWPGIPYIVETSTYIHNSQPRLIRRNRHEAYITQQLIVMLDPKTLAYLATDEGFREYMKTAAETKPTLPRTSGGIKKETLAKLGAIQFIAESAEELQLMEIDETRQQKLHRLADKLVAGTLNPDLFDQYLTKFPQTSREVWTRRRSSTSN